MSLFVERKRSSRSALRFRAGVRSVRLFFLAAFFAMIAMATPTTAFHLNMVATHGATARRARLRSRTAASNVERRRSTSSGKSGILSPPSPPAVGGGVTTNLVSNLAVVALKHRLAAQTSVQCDVSGSPTDLLLRGAVGPVTVRGRGWSSPLGLTCRAIEATVGQCQLDLGSVVGRGKLVLTTVAKGDALIALDGLDFANFVSHPLMKAPSLPACDNESESTFQFIKDGVNIRTLEGESEGEVVFYGMCADRRWKCVLRRGTLETGRKASVLVTPADEADSQPDEKTSRQLSKVLSNFFNEMVFELDGTYLSFRDMMVTSKGGRDSANVLLSLSITVKKFPSRGLAF